jgi:hypothetical protein
MKILSKEGIIEEIAEGIVLYSNCIEEVELNTVTHLADICNEVQKSVNAMVLLSTLKSAKPEEGWVCKHCGKSTFETDYDYLADVDEHLGCALEKEQQARKKMDKMVSKHPQIKHPEWLI